MPLALSIFASEALWYKKYFEIDNETFYKPKINLRKQLKLKLFFFSCFFCLSFLFLSFRLVWYYIKILICCIFQKNEKKKKKHMLIVIILIMILCMWMDLSRCILNSWYPSWYHPLFKCSFSPFKVPLLVKKIVSPSLPHPHPVPQSCLLLAL